jgi:hypothetical protein
VPLLKSPVVLLLLPLCVVLTIDVVGGDMDAVEVDTVVVAVGLVSISVVVSVIVVVEVVSIVVVVVVDTGLAVIPSPSAVSG